MCAYILLPQNQRYYPQLHIALQPCTVSVTCWLVPPSIKSGPRGGVPIDPMTPQSDDVTDQPSPFPLGEGNADQREVTGDWLVVMSIGGDVTKGADDWPAVAVKTRPPVSAALRSRPHGVGGVEAGALGAIAAGGGRAGPLIAE